MYIIFLFPFYSSDVDDTLLRDSERSVLMSPSCSTSSTEIQSCATSRTCDESRYLGRDSTHDQKMKVRSVSEFVKTPLPDVYGHYPPLHPEPLHTKKPGIQRSVLAFVPVDVIFGSH